MLLFAAAALLAFASCGDENYGPVAETPVTEEDLANQWGFFDEHPLKGWILDIKTNHKMECDGHTWNWTLNSNSFVATRREGDAVHKIVLNIKELAKWKRVECTGEYQLCDGFGDALERRDISGTMECAVDSPKLRLPWDIVGEWTTDLNGKMEIKADSTCVLFGIPFTKWTIDSTCFKAKSDKGNAQFKAISYKYHNKRSEIMISGTLSSENGSRTLDGLYIKIE